MVSLESVAWVLYIYVVTWWGGPGGEQCNLFLQCSDAVGWVFGPVKTVSKMAYTVPSGTLNPTKPILVVITSAIDCLETLISEMTCYVSGGTVIAHLVGLVLQYKI